MGRITALCLIRCDRSEDSSRNTDQHGIAVSCQAIESQNAKRLLLFLCEVSDSGFYPFQSPPQAVGLALQVFHLLVTGHITRAEPASGIAISVASPATSPGWCPAGPYTPWTAIAPASTSHWSHSPWSSSIKSRHDEPPSPFSIPQFCS